MKFIDSFTWLLLLTFLSCSAAEVQSKSFVTPAEEPEMRDLQITLGFLGCKRSLISCIASNGPSGDLPINEWSSFLDSVDDDTLGVVDEIRSILVQPDVADFEEMFDEIEESMSPEQVAAVLASAPAVIKTLKSIDVTESNVDGTVNILRIVLQSILWLLRVVNNSILWFLEMLIDVTLGVVSAVLNFEVGVTKTATSTPAVLALILTGIASFLTILIVGVTVVFIKGRTFGRASACEAELLLCEYEKLLTSTIPSLLTVAFPDAAP